MMRLLTRLTALTALLLTSTSVKLDAKRKKSATAILERRKGKLPPRPPPPNTTWHAYVTIPIFTAGKFGHGIKAAILEEKEIYRANPPPPPPPPPSASIAEWKAYGSAWLEHPMGKRFCWTSLLASLFFATMATLSYAARSWWAFHRRMVSQLWLVTLHNDKLHTSQQAAEKLALVLPNMTLDEAIVFVQGTHMNEVLYDSGHRTLIPLSVSMF